MAFRLEVIKPKKIDFTSDIMSAIEDALDEAAREIQSDFQKTVATWKDKPGVQVRKSRFERLISISNERYSWLNQGTKPHIIVAKGKALRFQVPYGPKTAPRQINSTAGSRGSTTLFRKVVHHPGIKAREFDDVIAEKAQKEVPSIIEQFLRRADV